jgi:hypothetical protein
MIPATTTADGHEIQPGTLIALWFACERGGVFMVRGTATDDGAFVADLDDAPRAAVADGYADPAWARQAVTP